MSILPVLPLESLQPTPYADCVRESVPAAEQILVAWHLLSLDAPSIVVAWVVLVAETRHAPVAFASLLVNFGAVWLIYIADRLLDSRAGRSEIGSEPLERRHDFCAAHRIAFLAAGGAVALLLIILLDTVSAALVPHGLELAGALLIWFGLIHLAPATLRRRMPKEIAAGVFFALTVFSPASGLGLIDRSLLLPAILFAALCTLNGAFISAWEQPNGGPARALPQLALLLASAALVASAGGPWPLLWPMAVSAGLLMLLDRKRASLGRTSLRAAADLVLLTPLLVLPFMTWWHLR